MKPTKSRELGPFNNIGLRLQFDASYEDLDAFLAWAENDHRLLRVDSLKVEPTKDHAQLNVQLDLLSLAAKEKVITPRAAGSRRKAGRSPMNTLRLLKLAPTLIMAAAMAYAAFSINAQVPPVAVTRPTGAPPAGTGGIEPDSAPRPAAEAPVVASRRGRNPFVALVRPGQKNKSGTELAGGLGAGVDPYLAVVQGLTLNATFVQGKTQYASINGRLYQRGQNLKGTGDEASFLVVDQVTPAEVFLEAKGSRYRLGYPDGFTTPADRPKTGPGRGRRSSPASPRGRPASPPNPQASRSRLP